MGPHSWLPTTGRGAAPWARSCSQVGVQGGRAGSTALQEDGEALWAPRGHAGTHSPDIRSFTLSCGSLAHRRKSRLLSAWPSRPHKARPTPTLACQTWFLSTSCSLLSPSRCVHAAGLLPQPFTEAAPALPSGPTSGFRPRPQAKVPCVPPGLHITTAGFGREN